MMMRIAALVLLAAPVWGLRAAPLGRTRLGRGFTRPVVLSATIDDSVGAETEAPPKPKTLTLAQRIAMEIDASMVEDVPVDATVLGEVPDVEEDIMERIFAEDLREVILFDSNCVFCDASVQFIMANEAPKPGGLFRYASQDSEVGQKILKRFCGDMHLDTVTAQSSFIVLERNGFHMRGDAVLRIAEQLRFPWNIFAAGSRLAPHVQDRMYEFVSQNRHAFGSKDHCVIPDEETESKFLV